jgi:hypothetical protein
MPAAAGSFARGCSFGKTGQSSRAGAGTPYIVGPAASERFDVPQFGACSHRAARQLGHTGERIRAADAAGRIGRRGQFGDQRRALRSPANPSVLSDPSGIGNASRIPPLRTNSPPPPLVYGPIGSSSPSRVVAPTRARRSASSAQIRLTQEGRRSAGAVGHRSESLRGFAGAVNASRTDARFWRTSRRDPGRGVVC